MKLIFCKECKDVVNLCLEARKCLCGKSTGQYTDTVNAVYTGPCVPLGFNNRSFLAAVQSRPVTGAGKDFAAFVIPEECASFKKSGA